MGNFETNYKEKEKRETRNWSRKELLAKFFYDLAKTTFAVMVLGNASTLFGFSEAEPAKSIITALLGSFGTFIFAYTGNKIIK